MIPRLHALSVILSCLFCIGIFSVSHGAEEPRPTTDAEKAALKARGLPVTDVITPTDAAALKMGGFKDYLAKIKQTSPCNKNPSNLAYRTRNTGAQVCGSTASKWKSIGCHSNNNTAIFPTHSHGFAAHVDLLRKFCATQGRCTVTGLFGPRGSQSYATGSANNFNYVNFVTKYSGIPANLVFNPNDPEVMGKIAVASACLEGGGFPWTVDDIEKGLGMAFGGPSVPVPSNVGQLLNESMTGGFSNSGSVFSNAGSPGGFSPPTQQLSQQPFNSPQQSPSSGGGSGGGSGINPSTTTAFQPGTQPWQTPLQNQLGLGQNSTPTNDLAGGIASISCTSGKVSWSCDSPATISRGVAIPSDTSFKTNGALVGSLKMSSARKTTYTIQCLRNQRIVDEASCASSSLGSADGFEKTDSSSDDEEGPMVLSLSAEPTVVRLGKRTTITWDAIGASDCALYGTGVAGNGISGDEESEPFTRRGTYSYALECESDSGESQKTTVDVLVR